jgi:hypothetical protein
MTKNAALIRTLGFAATLFLGCFLLFLLEPLYAKLILPWFGGSASVWTLCLVFFQSALLAGYWYADFTTRRLNPRVQSLLHIALLLACLWLIPILPNPAWRSSCGSDPTWLILGLLATQIGLPFVLLSATSPLIQSWYVRSLPGRQPYVLFALSNAASLLALLCFPFLLEPYLSSGSQSTLWSSLFVLYVLLCSSLAWINGGTAADLRPQERRRNPGKPAVTAGERLVWIGLSACGSMLLLSITNHLCRDVAAMPFLWVLPLSLYLISFILVFGRQNFYPAGWMPTLLAAALVFLNYVFYEPFFLPSLELKILALGAGLLVGCLFCHGELARRKPEARVLTDYYLMIALGGALGAMCIGLAAPRMFSGLYEYPLSLLCVSLAALFLLWRTSQFHRALWGVISFFLVFVLFQDIQALKKESIVMERNFYAALRVVKQTTANHAAYLTLCNGVVVHGKQFLDEPLSMEATAYYSKDSGAGLALRYGFARAKRVGLIGLGTGTLAVFGNSGDVFRFYEINPQVTDIAWKYFSFLKKSRATIEIVPGDARLTLEGEPPQNYDFLAVDAFSGDAIPVHLLTRECFALYLRHLKPDGILAFHTSNLYLDLAPVVKLLADEAGYEAVIVRNRKDEDKLIDVTEWVLVTRNQKVLEQREIKSRKMRIKVPPGFQPWTDDYNSLFRVLKKQRFFGGNKASRPSATLFPRIPTARNNPPDSRPFGPGP